jgi:tRNA pseudouridine55 synthase
MLGFLNLDKPPGLTSHDCVSKVRRVLREKQVGHGGTLDPAATGVLPIAVGRATRFLPFLSGEKVYRATFVLGQTSTTDDAEGNIVTRTPSPRLFRAEVERALAQFVGPIQQVPPAYSAIRLQGRRLYELAREGATVESLQLEPRSVTIHRLDCLAWREGDYPELDLDITCGTGTYIRAIARDLGHILGCGGLMSQLRRCQSGPFRLDASLPLDTWLESVDPSSALQPVESAFAYLPAIQLDPESAWRWCCGQKLPLPAPLTPGTPLQVLQGERFLGLGQWQEGMLRSLRVLASQG